MSTLPKRAGFFETEAGQEIEAMLERMQSDVGFNTTSTYTPKTESYPNSLMPFMDKHKTYLIAHPEIEPLAYLANLRLKTRLR